MKVHATQEALLGLIRERGGDLRNLGSLRNIGTHLGIPDNPQVIAYHLDQLQNKGLIRQLDPNEYVYKIANVPLPASAPIPLYRATAQCGPSGFFGSDDVVDQIYVSTKTFGIAHPSHFFFIKA